MKEAATILVVDDELQMAETIADALVDRGHEAVAIASSDAAAARLRDDPPDALVTDLRMPKADGLELLAVAREVAPDVPVIVMTAYGAIDSAIESIRRGAYHYLTKPFRMEELVLFLERALAERNLRREASELRSALRDRAASEAIIGSSRAMRDVFEVIGRVARTEVPVLLTGETGTGKSLIARTIHNESDRSTGRFVTINCAALPEALLESELFGHEKGAFTGASKVRPGLFVEADGGTLFLDEIGEMSPSLQAKLLDAIERRIVRPVGSTRERRVDVRIIAATHHDLAERTRAGAFREDLRYRLEVVAIELPPLRRRRGDIPLLAEQLLAQAKKRHAFSQVVRISPAALAKMIEYAWPGNVRELAHAVERMVLLGRGTEIAESDLPATWNATAPGIVFPEYGEVIPVRELQRRYAAWALEQMNGHRTRTAEKLNVDLKTLAKWLSTADD